MVNIQNSDDNDCFKWYLLWYLHPADHNPARLTKADKYFAKRLDFKDIKCPIKIRDIQNIEKRNSIITGVSSYENKEKYFIYVFKKMLWKKYVHL